MEEIKFNQIGVSFKGSGSYVPDQILTNEEISQKVDTSDEWIKSRTGISERRISSSKDNVTNMGYKLHYLRLKWLIGMLRHLI